MKNKLNLVQLGCVAFVAMPSVLLAAPNPVSWDKMVQYVNTSTTLTPSDWQAVCQSGSINSTGGCYGDAGSAAFAKINRLAGHMLDYAGVTRSAANSVWVRQLGDGTNCTVKDSPLSVLNTAAEANSTLWNCGLALTSGASVSASAGLGALQINVVDPTTTAGISFASISVGSIAAGGLNQLTNTILYFAGTPILPTAYAFCVSTSNSSVATAFAQAPAVAFSNAPGHPAC